MKYLDEYPFDERFRACHRFVDAIDWKHVHDEVRRQNAFFFKISDAVDLFPNLSLMQGYELYAYIFPEYHGLWGRVAAVKVGELVEPQITPTPFSAFPNSYELPETAVQPMSALYTDGSAYGYLDAILAGNLFSELPYYQHQNYSEGCCLCKPPEDYPDKWDITFDIPDWRPRVKESENLTTIWLLWSELYLPLGDASYEEIVLKQYKFSKDPWTNAEFLRNSRRGMYRSCIKENRPYGSGRHCCLPAQQEILIAQKNGD